MPSPPPDMRDRDLSPQAAAHGKVCTTSSGLPEVPVVADASTRSMSSFTAQGSPGPTGRSPCPGGGVIGLAWPDAGSA